MSEQSENIDRRTNLDRFLDDLFRKKIEFQVSKTFIRCLQTTVEKYVRDLLDELMKLQDVQTLVKNLKDTYQDNYNLFSERHEVLKVGSFYEGTKNTFPNEFDYVFILLNARRLIHTKSLSEKSIDNRYFSDRFINAIKNVLVNHVKDLTDYSIRIQSNQLFDLKYRSLKEKGPACKLRFTLKKKIPGFFKGKFVNIHVDITPAIRVIDSFLPLYVGEICFFKEFQKEIIKTGSFIVIEKVGTRLSFTETEVLFMKNSLSTRHKRTYRLLKYLINGDIEEDQLSESQEYMYHYSCLPCKVEGESRFEISSYVIKTLILYHHYSCKNDDIMAESHCVIDVLKALERYGVDSNSVVAVPFLIYGIFSSKSICYGKATRHFKKQLSELINTLMSYTEARDYDFDLYKTKVMPLSRRMYGYFCHQRTKVKWYKRCFKASIAIFMWLFFIYIVLYSIFAKR